MHHRNETWPYKLALSLLHKLNTEIPQNYASSLKCEGMAVSANCVEQTIFQTSKMSGAQRTCTKNLVLLLVRAKQLSKCIEQKKGDLVAFSDR